MAQHPQQWDEIPTELSQEIAKMFNAVPLTAVVTLDIYYGTSRILVNNKVRPSVDLVAMHLGVNKTLSLLANNGRAVTITREG